MREKTGETRVLKGLVARSGRRCAAVDPGGFGAAFSHDITPMHQAIRASSPHEMAHVVSGRKVYLPAHGCTAATYVCTCFHPSFSPNTVGRIEGAMSWGEWPIKEALWC
ncbi:hypothetical protein FCH32_12265 [Citrobacter gillenii]|uniref:Uncharacterized protein n=1 Tax=Citrobacter gillenii TaxID=67828 RepID=A0ABD6M345_9ENTR|nr:hypothetical protein [Citrobacter gillenii]